MAETKLTPEQAFLTARYKVGSFTRAADGGSGDVGYTGVGFKPSAVIFVSSVSSYAQGVSVGFDNQANHMCLASTSGAGWTTITTLGIRFSDGTSYNQDGIIKTLDADGFTLTWSKGGTPPAVTMIVAYIAFR